MQHLAWQISENLLDSRTEAHLEKLIRLVQDKGVQIGHATPQSVIFQQVNEPER